MAKLAIRVNGKRHVVEATRDTPLLYVLRNELELRGPRFGCGLGAVRRLHRAGRRQGRRARA